MYTLQGVRISVLASAFMWALPSFSVLHAEKRDLWIRLASPKLNVECSTDWLLWILQNFYTKHEHTLVFQLRNLWVSPLSFLINSLHVVQHCHTMSKPWIVFVIGLTVCDWLSQNLITVRFARFGQNVDNSEKWCEWGWHTCNYAYGCV